MIWVPCPPYAFVVGLCPLYLWSVFLLLPRFMGSRSDCWFYRRICCCNILPYPSRNRSSCKIACHEPSRIQQMERCAHRYAMGHGGCGRGSLITGSRFWTFNDYFPLSNLYFQGGSYGIPHAVSPMEFVPRAEKWTMLQQNRFLAVADR